MALSPPPSQEQFDRLLQALSAEREQAGERYEAIRLKLIRFFSWEGLRDPDLWADETLNRTAMKLAEGAQIEKLDAYLFGVARFVAKEALRAETRETTLRDEVELPQTGSHLEDSRASQCLNQCLNSMPKRTRDLILGFYQGDAQARIRNRSALAASLNLNLNALRNRALRVRQNLEKCVLSCLERDTSRPIRTKGDAA